MFRTTGRFESVNNGRLLPPTLIRPFTPSLCRGAQPSSEPPPRDARPDETESKMSATPEETTPATESVDPRIERLEASVQGHPRGGLILQLSPKRTALQREKLRRLAHDLKPIVMVGRAGLSEGLLAALKRGLLDHELIKVKLLDAAPLSREAFALWVHEETKADAISWVGRTIIFYQRHPEKPKLHLPS